MTAAIFRRRKRKNILAISRSLKLILGEAGGYKSLMVTSLIVPSGASMLEGRGIEPVLNRLLGACPAEGRYLIGSLGALVGSLPARSSIASGFMSSSD